jgi:hypothetical protein
MNTFEKRLQEAYRSRPSAYSEKRYADFESQLIDLIAVGENSNDKCCVLGALVDHYHFVKNDSRALEVLYECTKICPERVEGWLGLAEHFHYYEVDLDAAANNIEIALQKAVAERCLVRQVLGVRIRISLARKAYGLVNESLVKLLDYQPPPDSIDVALESDFISEIPTNAANNTVVQRYKALVERL